MPHKTPVLLTFDLDAETLWTARDPEGANRPVWVSQGHYGPNVGLPRVLALLSRYDVTATFFVPGLVIERYPAAIDSILETGMQIEHHSHTHAWSENLSYEQEREEFQRGWDAIVRATGREPQGWRSPAAELTPHSVALMEEYGFSYSSNLFDSDSAHLLQYEGRTTNIVELPFAWLMDDAPYFLYSNRLPGRVMAAPSAVLETWWREFEGLRQEPRAHYMVAMHPQVIGRPSRIWVLERLLEKIRDSNSADFVSCADYVARVKPGLLESRPR
ncbi:MAG: polysaccharide deacetylase family protein [Haloechinothrix sp.]